MFGETVKEFDNMSVEEKQKRIIDELKLMIVVLEKICIERKIEYREVRSKEILDLKKENVSQSEYLTGLYVYVEYLKEVVGAYIKNDIG